MPNTVTDLEPLNIGSVEASEQGLANFEVLKTEVRERILHTLSIYPFISSSMLHIGIGTSNPVTLWRPILAELVAEGVVVVTQVSATTPQQRAQSYQIYHLATHEYPLPNLS